MIYPLYFLINYLTCHYQAATMPEVKPKINEAQGE